MERMIGEIRMFAEIFPSEKIGLFVSGQFSDQPNDAYFP